MASASRRLVALSVVSVFTSAFLLFLVEPMIAKMELPRFGGSPAVWNTCLVFFQILLLAGYGYSHFAARRMSLRNQLLVHGVLLLLPLAVLPPTLSAHTPPPGVWPVPSLVVALTVAVALPFLLLSTNASLVQHWYALGAGGEPYFLYSASNAGALIALLSYPLLIEPGLGLTWQRRGFAVGYVLFVALSGAFMWRVWRARGAQSTHDSAREPAASDPALLTPPTTRARLRWAGRAAVASALLLAVSLRIATDVASVPLLWVVPLGLYLVSFIVAFLPRGRYPRRALSLAAAYLIAVEIAPPVQDLPWLQLALPLALLFVGCWVCHADLAEDRPAPAHLTDFYLWVAVGGCVGGLFCNLVAPLLFRSVAEYPIALVLLAFVLAVGDQPGALVRALRRPAPYVGLLALALVAFGGAWLAQRSGQAWLRPVSLGVLLLALIARKIVWVFPVAALVFATALLNVPLTGSRLAAERSFFGTLRVVQLGANRALIHGTTYHGMQQTEPLRKEPLLYYHRASPLTEIMRAQPPGARIAITGLGTGGLAAWSQPGQSVTYYELDPTIEPIARRWFTYLADSPASLRTVVGDARLTLPEAPAHGFSLVFLDAFSSDAVPVHLLTIEALQLYLDKLAPSGVLAFHISNRYLDLARVLRGDARALGLASAIRRFRPTPAQQEDGASPIDVVLLAREESALTPFRATGWLPLGATPSTTWTDDRSSLLGLLTTKPH